MPISGCHDLPLATFNLPSRVFRHGCRRAECPERRRGGCTRSREHVKESPKPKKSNSIAGTPRSDGLALDALKQFQRPAFCFPKLTLGMRPALRFAFPLPNRPRNKHRPQGGLAFPSKLQGNSFTRSRAVGDAIGDIGASGEPSPANPPPLIRRRGFFASALLRYNSAMLVAGNWKMHGSAEFVRKWLDEWEAARDGVSNAVEVAVFPPFPFLGALADGEKRGFALGGQDCSAESVGARTGEVSAGMLAECGCRFALAGHSERRRFWGEDGAICGAKMRAAAAAGLTPILCVGETAAERQGGKTEKVVRAQLDAAMREFRRESADGAGGAGGAGVGWVGDWLWVMSRFGRLAAGKFRPDGKFRRRTGRFGIFWGNWSLKRGNVI